MTHGVDMFPDPDNAHDARGYDRATEATSGMGPPGLVTKAQARSISDYLKHKKESRAISVGQLVRLAYTSTIVALYEEIDQWSELHAGAIALATENRKKLEECQQANRELLQATAKKRDG
jgi:hypothetical protein|tara:strand:+ start:928 stop:1287 length:360 start_codon:yes stop_codon:yes gene_type:complete